jgi:hypothetical protein
VGGFRGMGDEGDPAEVARAVVEAAKTLKATRKNRKLERLKHDARVAEKKALQSKRLLEEESRKRSRARVTIGSYFLTTRNADNLTGRLQLCGKGIEGDGGNIGGGSCNAKGGSTNMVAACALPNPRGGPAFLDAPPTSGSSATADCEEDTVLELSTPGIVNVSNDSNAFVYSKDNPNFKDPKDRARELESESDDLDPDLPNYDSLDSEDDFVSDSDLPGAKRRKFEKGKRAKVDGVRGKQKKKSWKQRYDVTCGFQEVWAAKLPWSEAILSDGLLHMVRCKICSNGRKECVMAPKWDTLSKHGIRDCHKKNELFYAARQPPSVLDQI